MLNKQTELKLWLRHYREMSLAISTAGRNINSAYLVEKVQDIELERTLAFPPFGVELAATYDHRLNTIKNSLIPQLTALAAKFEISLLGMNERLLSQMDRYEALEKLNAAVQEYNVFMDDMLNGIGGHTNSFLLESNIIAHAEAMQSLGTA